MKICWDMLEGVRLNKNGVFIKGVASYVYNDCCRECGEPFLQPRYVSDCLCSRDCVNRSDKYRKLKSDLQKGKPSGMKGRNLSAETKQKISLAHTGKEISEEHKRKISNSTKGKKKPFGFGAKISKARKGVKFSKEWCRKMSENHADFSGSNHPNWKGGISKLPYCPNWTKEYKDDIKERDCYKCLNPYCYHTNTTLAVHHIDYTKTLCGPDNLITLCGSCNSRANTDREWHTQWYRTILNKRYGYIY